MRVTNVHQLNKQTNQANTMMNHAQTHTHRPFDHSGQMRKPQQCTRIELCIFSSINTKYDNHIYRRIFKFRWNIIIMTFFLEFSIVFYSICISNQSPTARDFFYRTMMEQLCLWWREMDYHWPCYMIHAWMTIFPMNISQHVDFSQHWMENSIIKLQFQIEDRPLVFSSLLFAQSFLN